ncbi:MAG: glycoside hydrolase family 3 C-terminal domain-containing protein [Firmicutes bacterium]|nr:glycoside hydrolase family 3 C-terminal domain-containing protein [Bacillota bacterium]
MDKITARAKARELVRRMTLEEKTAQMLYEAPGLPELGIPAYNWWNEALHGVARSGRATVFPQSIGLAASFDPALVRKIGEVIAEEGRIIHEIYKSEGKSGIYQGLTYWSPNINIVRDPRWGRAHETYGEDPYLTSRMGTEFVRGLQGEDPDHLTASACCKHLAAHSGPEGTRHGFNAAVSRKDLFETYLPAFERVVKDADVSGIMTAYNAINGIPASAHRELLQEIIRKEWRFDGYIVSDCGAIQDIYEYHHYTDTKAEAAGKAAEAGCELNCGSLYGYLNEAVHKGYVREEMIDQAVEDLLTIRFRLDMDGPFRGEEAIGRWIRKKPEWNRLSELASEEALVLLKNDGLLPLTDPKTIAVIGPNARSVTVLEGNYHGTADETVTVLQGIREEFPGAAILGADGAHLYKDQIEAMSRVPDDQVPEAVAFAKAADVTVLCLGLDPSIEGEQGDASNEYGAGDKPNLLLPASQRRLLAAVAPAAKKLVVILLSGGALDLGDDERYAGALIQAWYPGAYGGRAIAGVLSGRVDPTGRLPETFYYNEQVSWDFEDYRMEGKTYRFFREEPKYPFGFGLSFRKLSIEDAALEKDILKITISNPHEKPISMPVMVFAEWEGEKEKTPIRQLVFAERITLEPGERKIIQTKIDPYWLMIVREDGARIPHEGTIRLKISDHAPDPRSCRLAGTGFIEIIC